ncbi:3-keto-disaccharide hydrolase [Neolewinella sp.]|uniref:3-keto-disaccharide hydrolase n=1 Tax=Neolewinella sp. TaxID=2993543 RepID=UPI003B52EC5A
MRNASHHPLRIVLILTLISCLSRCSPPPAVAATPAPTPPSAATTTWQSLFNGRDLTGWTPHFAGQEVGVNFRNTFRVQDSMLRVSYADYDSFDGAYGHLYYRQPYSHYKFRFEYRFVGQQVPGGESWNVRNSGVMFHSQSAESNELAQTFPVSIELQLLGGLSDGEPRTTGNVCTPGTAVVYGDTIDYRHCINSSSATYDGDGWIRAEAVVRGGQGMDFLIEGDTVLQFTQPQIGGGFIFRSPGGADWQQAGITTTRQAWLDREGELLTEGYIALQAESHGIDFRHIELLDLSE